MFMPDEAAVGLYTRAHGYTSMAMSGSKCEQNALALAETSLADQRLHEGTNTDRIAFR